MKEIDTEEWIHRRAYELWQYREKSGIPNTPEENWYDAEASWLARQVILDDDDIGKSKVPSLRIL